jgi:hypothetical protein
MAGTARISSASHPSKLMPAVCRPARRNVRRDRTGRALDETPAAAGSRGAAGSPDGAGWGL